ncbi:MAG: zf-HC2 domain-containing protein [Ignavibacteria bacterium]|nr:zf-HC2 domain-containing protein [Bacteroidota bacterium]MSQ45966.1 zf-HC2 domain-containing protein [Ignavibacteria bacterium]
MLDQKCNDIKYLLPEFIEGGLSSEQLKSVEEHLFKCSSCNNIITDLKYTYQYLQTESLAEVPKNYFSELNFQVNQRIENKKWMPIFSIINLRYVTTIAAMLVISIISALYLMLDENSYNNSYIVNRQFDQKVHSISNEYYAQNENNIYQNDISDMLEKDYSIQTEVKNGSKSIMKIASLYNLEMNLDDVILYLLDGEAKIKSDHDYLLALSDILVE